MFRLRLTIFVLFLSILYSRAQLNLTVINTGNPELIDIKKIQTSFSTSEEREKEIQKVLKELHDKAYLTANIDSSKKDDKNLAVYINPGKPYQWAHLKKGNIDEGVLSSVGFREKLYSGKSFYYTEVLQLEEKIIRYFENNGYPFASIKLDSISIINETISASLLITKNKLIKIDSIITVGDAQVAKVYLQNYIGIKQGSLYNEAAAIKIADRLKELPFIKSGKAPYIQFTDQQTKLYLFLEKKKASHFDGIIGILPNEETKKTQLTGDVQLKLQNSLGRGELFDLNWRSLGKGTQDLKAHITYPFFFSTPFGIDYNIKLYKKDTSFIDINQNIGVQYLLKGNNYFKAFYKSRQSSLISTKGLENITVLPPYADIKANTYGLEMNIEKLDYRFNPRKGFVITTSAATGNRNIIKNSKINPIVYDGIQLKTVQYETEFSGKLFIPLFQRSTIQIRSQLAWFNSKSIFQNELYRIGGIKTLRGFDEESIYASFYTIGSIEYRYLLEQNSYLYVFADGAYYENLAVSFSGDRYDTPFGFGSGISFETKAGVFSINYALGKQFNNPIFLKSGKVHFGIVNYF